ncbi:molybdate ABC transporter permease subunit [Pseudovibrio sp. SPO723]|uniref:molybdate ABC transporter permease subunit n=1 Tax=Nesiotobacter zosterae TaxID=392721 RepID=UPI0029C4C075|nr:molybdate ABC transporter permease subunit [Pseudovibrio sp. SPO723]MDX5594836.1 molybdate ABC transporter permease subunit [Pseudovibrio sp. SPO723]
MTDVLSNAEWSALLLSLQVAGTAMAFGLPLAVFLAYALSRWNFTGKLILNVLIYLPLVLPPVVTGYVLLLGFGRNGPLGQFFSEWLGVGFAFQWTGAALAAGVMAFPLLLRPIKLAFDAADPLLEEAARSLGTSRLKTFAIVTLPLALPGILGGTILGFAKAMGEFGATITFVSNIPGETRTLSLALYTELQSVDGDAAVLRLAAISLLISFVALGLSELLARSIETRVRGRA